MAEIPDAAGRFQSEPARPRPLEVDEDYPGSAGRLTRDPWRQNPTLSVFGTLVNFFVILVLGFLIATTGVVICGVLLAFQIFVYSWLLYAYVSYRQGRQEELLQVLRTAVESGAPLAGALQAYEQDRPNGRIREFLVAAGLCLLLPGYYWIWYRWYNYDRLVEKLALLLEQGMPLHQALQRVPGVAPRETMLAATVGQTTGQLAMCLRYASRQRLTDLWAEVLPRLLYPLALCAWASLVVTFYLTYLLPKMQRLFKEAKLEFPAETERFVHSWPMINLSFWFTFMVGLFLFVLQLSLSSVRWYFPVLGWFYRKHVQSRGLQMLGVLIEAGKPIPEALALLAGSGYFQGIAVDRLERVRRDVSQGDNLGHSLFRAGLLPEAMAPLVQASERLGNLPATLAELGNHLFDRMIRCLRWISLVFCPLALLAVAWLVFQIALSLFVPLIKLMEGSITP
jgi:type II secretory pathway component PulF